MNADRRRLRIALLLSVLIHAPLLALTVGDEGLGLPGFEFPWRKRRVEAPDLRVTLMPARVSTTELAQPPSREPVQQPSIEKIVVRGPAPPEPAAALPGRTAEVFALQPEVAPRIEAKTVTLTSVVPAKVSRRKVPNTEAARAPVPVSDPLVEPPIMAVERPNSATYEVPLPPPAPVIAEVPIAPTPETILPTSRDAAEIAQKQALLEARERAMEAEKLEAARLETERQERARVATANLEAQRQEVARQEAARAEAARQETQRQEAARNATARLEAQRQEVTRLETARIETARLEAQRQQAQRVAAAQAEAQRKEAIRQEAARAESAKQEAARLETERREAVRGESARVEAARLETERQEAVRQAAAQKEAARVLAEKEEDARREARRQAMGRILNEEAARREAESRFAKTPNALPLSLSTARRGRLWGRSDPNVELVQHAEAWARKIQFNTPVETVRDLAKRPHIDPMVTVAIRNDGSVESVTFVLSSGVPEVDQAIRRMVESQAPYQAFSPALAREYDVVEIRRTWHFDTAVRLY
jgi:chemotaxis protein histidine kinase CheA